MRRFRRLCNARAALHRINRQVATANHEFHQRVRLDSLDRALAALFPPLRARLGPTIPADRYPPADLLIATDRWREPERAARLTAHLLRRGNWQCKKKVATLQMAKVCWIPPKSRESPRAEFCPEGLPQQANQTRRQDIRGTFPELSGMKNNAPLQPANPPLVSVVATMVLAFPDVASAREAHAPPLLETSPQTAKSTPLAASRVPSAPPVAAETRETGEAHHSPGNEARTHHPTTWTPPLVRALLVTSL